MFVFVVLLGLSLFDDFNGDIGELSAYMGRNALDVLSYFAMVLAGCFFGMAFFLWGFWRTSWAKKGASLLIALCAGACFYVYVYYDFLVFDYVVKDNPYQGVFARDQALDANNRLDVLEKYPEYYRDTIGSSYIRIDKYRAGLRNNKSRLERNYNVCMKGEQIILTAVNAFFDKGDYCAPDTLIKGDNAVKLTLKPIGENQFECIGCDDYFLPVFWNHYPENNF